MNRTIYLLLLALAWLPLCASHAPAQSVTFTDAEIKAEKNEGVFLIPKVDGGFPPKWRADANLIDDTAKYEAIFGQIAKGKIYRARADGKYKIECWCAKGDKASDIAVVWITVGTPAPDPPPIPPGPTPPDPSPVNPTATKLYLLTFDDEFSRPAGSILTDKGYWKSVQDRGHSFRQIDTKNPDAGKWQPWYTKGGVTGPALVVLSADTAKLTFMATVPLPADASGVDAVIKKYTAGK